jgi:P27 family predicted phage terminase small subunit
MYELLGNTLEGMRVLTVADGLMLAEAARTWEELAQAREALAGHGALEYPTVTVVGTMWRAYPAVGMVSDAHRRWVACLAKLGLTPSDRSRLKLAEQPQTLTPLAALLAGAPSQRGQVGHA